MYIKQIIIQGFKSYKDQTVIEPFSPGTNVIVGRNGSGKSNFFAAIRFVLSDSYVQMSREERQALLHEGSGSAVMSAYVEIIFDNSDDRFPTGNKETILRRTIGLKKDEYSLDRKVITKIDVNNLLETAGFSKANPYYIVPQGRVTALTNMKESDRLNLLKEVAGTQVYEARRTESLKIMTDTNNKREKIDELLEYIKERLSELEEEKEELRGYQTKDRERRCLEYAYYHREQVRVQEALEEEEDKRQGGLENTDSDRTQFLDYDKAIETLNAEINQKHKEMDLLEIDRRQLDEDRRDASKNLANMELKVKTLSEGQSAQEQASSQREAEIEAVESEIRQKKAELVRITPEFNKQKAKENDVKLSLDNAEASRARLFTKQSHGTQFRTKQERDRWLTEQIAEVNLGLSAQKANKMEADEDIKARQDEIKKTEADVTDLRQRLQGWGGQRTSLAEEATKARDELERLNEERKRLRRDDDRLEAIIADTRREKESAERHLSHAMDGATARGLAAIRRMKQQGNIPGAHGTLAELLEVSEAYRLPVEQIAGSSLFHYVVDDAETATYLANALYKESAGRVTFMPLKELRPKQTKFPRAEDAVPLIEKIKFDPQFDKAFRQVFGKVILCPNLTIAGQYARSHGVDGITMDGDMTNKRGAMTGGYIDTRKSRLQAVSSVNKWTEEYEKLMARSNQIRKEIERKDQEITHATGEKQKADQKLKQTTDGYEPLRIDLKTRTGQLDRARLQLESATKRLEGIERNMREFAESIAASEAELASDFKKTLTAAEERQLEELGTRVQQFQKTWNDVSAKRRELENRKKMLEIDLDQNLQPRLDQLNSQAFEQSTATESSGGLKEANRELKKLQKTSANVASKLKETDQKLEQLQATIAKLQGDKSSREQAQVEVATRIERNQKRIEKSLQRKAVLMEEASRCGKIIRDLGVLPEEAFDKYERMSIKTIESRLEKVNQALKKYKHVNKKAFEQYNSFTNQQDQLLERRKELDASQGSIEELVQHLDRRKDEAIERTFKQVSKEFATIFEKLVPAGHGRLVIQRRADRRAQDADESEDDQRGGGGNAVENYIGVGISVSFNSKTLDEQQKIQQLSGGQKSLCALCLIFALQQTESSPMVIFDEVDANLDAQYRTAVASLLQSISSEAGTQFICTTFRPEIVHVADKCYGVLFRTKTSSVDCVSTEEALSFVEGQAVVAR